MPPSARTDGAAEQREADRILGHIEGQVARALDVLLKRATREESVSIRDRKPGLPEQAQGPLQDCEFGMILLHGRDWLEKRGRLEGALADTAKVEAVVLELVRRTVDRVLTRQDVDEGGEFGDLVFFSGQPYTLSQEGKVSYYSANLDSAMLTVAFLAPAASRYNAALVKARYQGEKLPRWVQSLRDAALFVCRAGIDYAEACKVMLPAGFAGFTSDPTSNVPPGQQGYLERDEDRLFFTWTACETIHDLVSWLPYLDSLKKDLPKDVAEEIRAKVVELQKSLADAARWCEATFLKRFQKLDRPFDIGGLVSEIESLGKGRPSDEQNSRLAALEGYVQHVYHISQYAAIRSLAPKQVSIDEVRTISERLHILVTRDVIGSQLDATKHPRLFTTLTRQYDLGKSSSKAYADDAYYPLVVRSLSGLLTRTIADLGKTVGRKEVVKLSYEFRRVLQDHCQNLLERRPAVAEEGDEMLWSFAKGNPFVFYATQRTVFALVSYANLLVEMDRFEQEEDTDETFEANLTELLAQTLVKNLLGGAVKEIVSLVKEQGPRAAGASAAANGQPPAEAVPLPKDDTAARPLKSWLEKFTREYEASGLVKHLEEQARTILKIRDFKVPEGGNKRVAGFKSTLDSARKALTENLKKAQAADGSKLTEFEWEVGNLVPLLFSYLFAELVSSKVLPVNDWPTNKSALWQNIDLGRGAIEELESSKQGGDKQPTG